MSPADPAGADERKAKMKATKRSKPNGVVIWRGPSALDGETPVVAIATGLVRPSENIGTGPKVQVWFLLEDTPPTEAVKDGQDAAICGDCAHRGRVGKEGEEGEEGPPRSCYVIPFQAPLQVYEAYHAGMYVEDFEMEHIRRSKWFKVFGARFGAYGDMAVLPAAVLAKLDGLPRGDAGNTAYTHVHHLSKYWERMDSGQRYYLQRLAMASIEDEADEAYLQARGWRTFYSIPPGYEPEPKKGIVQCPKQEGLLDCSECGYCDGNAKEKRGSVRIEMHGSAGLMKAAKVKWPLAA